MNKLLGLLLASTGLALAGCPAGADVAGACNNYFDAYEDCAEEAGTDLPLEDDYCETTYGDTQDQASADYLNCLADAYDNGDCTDSTTIAQIDLSGCTIE